MYIKDFDDVITNTNFRAFAHTNDIVKGKIYDKESISLIEQKDISDETKYYHFEVDSNNKNTYYDVSVYIENENNIVRTLCDCNDFRIKRSCEHIAAVFYHNYEMFFNKSITNISKITNELLKSFLPTEGLIKKELNVTLALNFTTEFNKYFYGDYKKLNVRVSVGDKKLYVLGNHVNQFKRVYESQSGEVYFGKEFTYNPINYYTTSESDTILNAYFELTENNYNYFRDNDIKKFLSKLKNITFIFNDYLIEGIEEEFFIESFLSKKDNKYELKVDLENIEEIIPDDYEYILYKGKLYHLDANACRLIKTIKDNNLEGLVIEKNNFNTFTKGLLKVLRKGLKVLDSADDVVIPKDIKTRIYFDLRNNYIEANIKFLYDEVEIDYFSEDAAVLRDADYEAKVINEIIKYGFSVFQNKIRCNDIELQVEFMEHGLEELASRYEVFTTEKFKNVNIKKKTNVSSMFKIGTNNILSYNFNLGDINSNELVDIFKDMKSKKKYYRLKNGDILSLEDEYLKELNELSEELELSDEEIIEGKGSILKYRALYLDSLKNTKYNIINTDNLFDEFIANFYKYKDSDLSLDKKDLRVLRDYQVVGVKWLKILAKTGFGGILADEMGLGKTIQIIYYIKEMLNEDNKAKFLIVVPTSLSYNWQHEFEEFGKNIKTVIVAGTKDKRINILKNIDDVNVLITTYGTLREDIDLYETFTFNTMIIDEAQNIKNNVAGITKCVKKVKASTKLALTGTPLENNVLELWSIFDFVMPGYLSSLTKFQSKYKIKDFDSEGEALIKGLSKQINPFILRRKKQDVIKELPEKLINDIYIELNPEQKKLYVAELEKVKTEMEKIIEAEGISKARFLILQLLTKLRQICIDPSIIYEDYQSGSNKLDRLEEIVKEYTNNNHKILIFSSFKTALNIVKNRLNKEGIKTYMIDGSVLAKTRVELVDSFNNEDDVKVFLIMLKSGGTGLNLASADVVIHLDLWWNPQAENQATDRAHRIGQKNIVEVIHLITKGTIEEKILELQNKKRILSDKLIDGDLRDKNILGSLTKEDIKNLLSYENRD